MIYISNTMNQTDFGNDKMGISYVNIIAITTYNNSYEYL